MSQETVIINEHKLNYIDWGNPDKQTILLLHGWGQTARIWDFLALSLRDRYHCIALDQRGHGESDWAHHGDYSTRSYIEDLKAFLSIHNQGAVILIGLSLGARNSYVFAADHPALIKGLILVDSGPAISKGAVKQIKSFMNMPDTLDSFEQFVERVHTFNNSRPIDQITAGLKHNLTQLPNGKWTWKYDPILRSKKSPSADVSEEYLWGCLRRINCPTLIVRGGNSDILTNQTATEMVASMGNASMVTVPDAGHRVPGDNPLGFERAVTTFLHTMDDLPISN